MGVSVLKGVMNGGRRNTLVCLTQVIKKNHPKVISYSQPYGDREQFSWGNSKDWGAPQGILCTKSMGGS